VTFAGNGSAIELLELSVTSVPPVGAVVFSVTVTLVVLSLLTADGLAPMLASEDTA